MHRSYSCRKQLGFTLVELSIVIVVVTLITSGIIAANSILQSAKLTRTITLVRETHTAAMTFKAKYNCIPGDCANVVALGIISAAGDKGDGDGNGKINTVSHMTSAGSGVLMKETMNFFHHLKYAQLMQGNYDGYSGFTNFNGVFKGLMPQLPLNDSEYLSALNMYAWDGPYFGNVLVTHSGNTATSNYGWALTAMESYELDSKIDDGDPVKGDVQTAWIGGPYQILPQWHGCLLSSGGVPTYDVQGLWASYGNLQANNPPNPAQRGCAMAFRGDW